MDIHKKNKTLLIEYFEKGSKNEDNKKLGVEIEHFIVERQAQESVSYYNNRRGIARMLEHLAPLYPHRFEKDGHLIGLYNDDYSLSLEPAGQLEISVNPQEDIRTVERIYNKLLKQIEPFLRKENCQLVTLGYQPKSKVEELQLIPKKRYEYMDRYFATTGTGGIHMMRGTASTQVAIDYVDEADFVLKYRVANILMPLLAILTDNSPTYKGVAYRKHLLRNNIWERVDNARCGMIKGIFDEDFGFSKYAEYLMNLPLIFMPTQDGEVYVADKTINDIKPEELLTPEDIDHILSMTFLDVRLKNYVEIRFADSLPFEYVKGYMALIKGIFYNEEVLHKIINDYQVDEEAIQKAKDSLSEFGFDGIVYGGKADQMLKTLLDDAKKILTREEREMLKPLEEIVENKKTLAEKHNEKLLVKYKNEINENFDENVESALDIKNYLEHSPVAYHGRCVHTLHIPKVFDKKVIEYFREITRTTYRIFTKIINKYLEDQNYRENFPFPEELRNLIDAPRGYDCVLPIARFDIFFNEEDWSFKFCEINTDGTSAMLEDYVLNMAIEKNIAHQKIKEEYQFKTFELFDSWVKTFMDIYDTYDKKVDKPYVAIVDFLENASITEFEEFKRHFEMAGYETEICEITQMKYSQGVLYSPTGHAVDVVYRRAVTSDIMARRNEVMGFLKAVEKQSVCIIGAFCTQIIHNKVLFKLLHEKQTLALLTKEEQDFLKEHIPWTYNLQADACCMDKVKGMKDEIIIKPLDSYGSQGVFAGIDYSQEEWNGLIEKYASQDYIYQEYCPPYRTDNIYLVEDKPVWKQYTNMSGLFVYNGELAGVYSRLSDGGIISSQYNEKAVATMYLD